MKKARSAVTLLLSFALLSSPASSTVYFDGYSSASTSCFAASVYFSVGAQTVISGTPASNVASIFVEMVWALFQSDFYIHDYELDTGIESDLRFGATSVSVSANGEEDMDDQDEMWWANMTYLEVVSWHEAELYEGEETFYSAQSFNASMDICWLVG